MDLAFSLDGAVHLIINRCLASPSMQEVTVTYQANKLRLPTVAFLPQKRLKVDWLHSL